MLLEMVLGSTQEAFYNVLNIMTSNSISRHLSYGSAQERYEENVLKNFTLIMKIGKHIGQIKGSIKIVLSV